MKERRRFLDEVSTEMDQMQILAGPSTKQDILLKSADALEARYGASWAGVSHHEVRSIIQKVAENILNGNRPDSPEVQETTES